MTLISTCVGITNGYFPFQNLFSVKICPSLIPCSVSLLHVYSKQTATALLEVPILQLEAMTCLLKEPHLSVPDGAFLGEVRAHTRAMF